MSTDEIVKDALGPDVLVTVGLPVYNAMPYLPEAMESLLGQAASSFEILAIVDGATDGSLAYLQTIRDQRLRIIEQPNLGVTQTLNRMLRECRTPWLVRQDADDVSHPLRIERMIAAIAEHPNAGMFYSLANYHPKGRAMGRFRSSRGSPRELRSIVRSGYLLAICHPTVALHVHKTLALGSYRLGLHNEGGLPEAAAMAAGKLRRRFPALRIAGTYCPPRGFERDSMESAHIRRLIKEAAPDLLCVAFGAPKQEIWMHENCPTLPIGAAIAVGAALDTQAGLRKRAPRWTHAIGMEWLYRLIREPKRLWRRYLFGNTQFVLLVLRQWLAGSRRISAPTLSTAELADSVDSLGA